MPLKFKVGLISRPRHVFWRHFWKYEIPRLLQLFLQFTYIVIIELCTWLGPRDFINLNYYFYLRFNFSGVLIAAYLVYYLRVRSNDALRYVRLKRPGAVQTRRQIECVKEFEAYFLPQVSNLFWFFPWNQNFVLIFFKSSISRTF